MLADSRQHALGAGRTEHPEHGRTRAGREPNAEPGPDTPGPARLPARHPGVSVNLRTLPSEMVVREVARGAADIGIAGEVACAEPVIRKQILIDELVGIAPVGLLGSDARIGEPGEFARHSLLLGPEGSSTRMITERHLARAEYRARTDLGLRLVRGDQAGRGGWDRRQLHVATAR